MVSVGVDVNGTRFHLIDGCVDWGRWRLEGDERTLDELWRIHADPPLEWSAAAGALRLTRQPPLFRNARHLAPIPFAARRGAGRDRYGNWYWIDEAESGIRFLPNGARQSQSFWTSTDLEAACAADLAMFQACPPPSPPRHLLRGLAVTTRHYLIVGDVTERGLLLFDLHGGGAPLLLRWPVEIPFTPWDIAARPDGGVLVLDRDHLTYWALDQHFRVLADLQQGGEALFQPTDPSAERRREAPVAYPRGYPLVVGSPPEPLSPVSIESGPEGHVLILDSELEDEPDARPYSIIYEYDGETLLHVYSLEDSVTMADPDLGGEIVRLSIVGHDFTYLDTFLGAPSGAPGAQDCAAAAPTEDGAQPTIYVAEREGNQVVAYVMDRESGQLVDQTDFFPLRRWVGKGLVAAGSQVYYDFADRWVPLVPFADCHYAARAVVTTPIDHLLIDDPLTRVPGSPFDGDLPGTVWHRLLLDAEIPPNTAVHVRARAADEPEALVYAQWIAQPDPYLRSGDAELPFYDPWPERRAEEPPPERLGTWELLFQEIEGRYLQLELTIEGNGRATPALRSLRAWYPRFSYLEQYLPAIYREDPVASAFGERWLANFEGFYTNLEDRIEQLWLLLDPDTTPPEALDWLACWFGIALDPLWTEERRRFFINHADLLYRWRGTVRGVEAALHMYLDTCVDESLFEAHCPGTGNLRIVERFLTRRVGGLIFGDPGTGGSSAPGPLTTQDVAASAHRFTVLVPHTLSAEQRTMVGRITELEKPAHTQADVRLYWALFRVGEARLGLDTRLGESGAFMPFLLGSTYLPEGYLAARYPFDVEDRIISDRDRLGELPPL